LLFNSLKQLPFLLSRGTRPAALLNTATV